MKGIIGKAIVTVMLLGATVTAYGACYYGWFLPEPLKQPVSLRDGSQRTGGHGYGLYFLGGRSHYSGGYQGGK